VVALLACCATKTAAAHHLTVDVQVLSLHLRLRSQFENAMRLPAHSKRACYRFWAHCRCYHPPAVSGLAISKLRQAAAAAVALTTMLPTFSMFLFVVDPLVQKAAASYYVSFDGASATSTYSTGSALGPPLFGAAQALNTGTGYFCSSGAHPQDEVSRQQGSQGWFHS
jgi:hypothetical protein